jgi:hypothetical protein
MSDEGSEEEVYEETTTGATDAAIGGAEVNWNLVYVYINTLSLSLSLSHCSQDRLRIAYPLLACPSLASSAPFLVSHT